MSEVIFNCEAGYVTESLGLKARATWGLVFSHLPEQPKRYSDVPGKKRDRVYPMIKHLKERARDAAWGWGIAMTPNEIRRITLANVELDEFGGSADVARML